MVGRAAAHCAAALGGRTFVLTTTLRAMKVVAEALSNELAELGQPLFLGLENLRGASSGDTGFAQQVSGVSVLGARKQYQEEVVEEPANLLAHRRVLVRLEDV